MSGLAFAALLAVAPAQQPPVFGAEVDVVRVEVSVTKDGQPVRGLSADQFELRDNGRLQPVRLVAEEEAPLAVALVLDLSGSVRGAKLTALKAAASAFQGGLREGEPAALVAFRDEVALLEDFTADRARLLTALGAAEPRGSTALRDAVYAALRLRPPERHRVVTVVFSDGNDNVSVLTASEVVQAASRTDGVVYGVGVRQRNEARPAFLQDLVRATGGRYFEAASDRDLGGRFLDVLVDVRSRYVLGFSPADVPQAGWHELTLRLERAKGDILARKGYWR